MGYRRLIAAPPGHHRMSVAVARDVCRPRTIGSEIYSIQSNHLLRRWLRSANGTGNKDAAPA